MQFTLEVLSNNPNATSQIMMGIHRASGFMKTTAEARIIEICEEVAKELKLSFERKPENILSFKDLQ